MTTFVLPCGKLKELKWDLSLSNYISFGCFISLVQNYANASKKRPGIKTQIPMSGKSIRTSQLLVRLLSPLNPCYS